MPILRRRHSGAAVVCKHCGRDLVGGQASAPAQKVTLTGVDPFAAYHTTIQGKKTGSITVVGYLGIGLGVLIMLIGGAALSQGTDGGEAGFILGLVGVGVSVASYLWVRR
jgi:hypothetical protein